MRHTFLVVLAVALLGAHATSSLAQLSGWIDQSAGRVSSVASSDATGAIAVVVREGQDPLRTTDGGQSWVPFTIAGARPSEVHIAPTDPRVWYAVANNALHRSADAGATWELRSRDFPSPNQFLEGVYYPSVGAHPDLLYAKRAAPSCASGFCFGPLNGRPAVISTDGGRNWRDLPLLGNILDGLRPSPLDPQVVYAFQGLDNGRAVQRSTDQGATWAPVAITTNSNVLASMFADTFTFDRHDPNVAYARTGSGYSSRRPIYITIDGGATWRSELKPDGRIVADPLQPRRAWLFAYDGSVLETRDAGGQWVLVEGANAALPVIQDLMVPPRAAVLLSGNDRHGYKVHGGKLERIDLTDGALALGADLWWNPNESGTGFTITHHPSRQSFVVWYAQDASGAPVWRVMPGGVWRDRTFTGSIFETRAGPWLGASFDPARVSVTRVGDATISFDDHANATFAWSLADGSRGEKRITRQLFGPVAAPNTAGNYSDLWWAANESGWGIALNHQYNTIFATWFVYDSEGRPQWLVMPDARTGLSFVGVTAKPSASGEIYIPIASARGAVTKVGTATFIFDSIDQAVLEFTVNGIAGRKTLTRQPF